MFNHEEATRIKDYMDSEILEIIAKVKDPNKDADLKTKEEICKILFKYKLKRRSKGFNYIYYLLLISIKENFIPHKNITTVGYPKIATYFCTTKSCVEHCIKSSIKTADSSINTLTNSRVIAMLYRELLIQLNLD